MSLRFLFTKYIADIPADKKNHLTVGVLANDIAFLLFIIFNATISIYFMLIYIAMCIIWEFTGKTKFSYSDILWSIAPIIPLLIIMLML